MSKSRIYWDNRFADATPVASSTASGDYNVLNVSAFRGYRRYKPATMNARIKVDCGIARPADSLFIWGHDLFTCATAIEVRGSTDNFSTSNVLVHSYTPPSDRPFARVWASQSFRYWALDLNGSIAPTLTVVCLGARLEIPGHLTGDSFDPVARRVVGQTHKNERGQPMGKIVDFEESTQTAVFMGLTWEWLRATWEPAWKAHIASEPVGWHWNAGVDSEPLLVMLGDEFTAPHRASRFADLTFTVEAVRT